MLRLIAIVAGIYFAARALRSHENAPGTEVRRFSDGPSEEEAEQQLRASV